METKEKSSEACVLDLLPSHLIHTWTTDKLLTLTLTHWRLATHGTKLVQMNERRTTIQMDGWLSPNNNLKTLINSYQSTLSIDTIPPSLEDS